MRIVLTEDAVLITNILDHPDISKEISDPSYEDITGIALHECIQTILPESLYFIIYNQTTPVGVVSFHAETPGILNGHMAFIRGFRGKFAYSASLKILEGLFTCTKYREIVTEFSSDKQHVVRLLQYAGFSIDYADMYNTRMVLKREEFADA